MWLKKCVGKIPGGTILISKLTVDKYHVRLKWKHMLKRQLNDNFFHFHNVFSAYNGGRNGILYNILPTMLKMKWSN